MPEGGPREREVFYVRSDSICPMTFTTVYL